MGSKLTCENLIAAAKTAKTSGLTIHIIKGNEGIEVDLRSYTPIVDSAKVQADPTIITLIPYRNVLEHSRTLVPVYVKALR